MKLYWIGLDGYAYVSFLLFFFLYYHFYHRTENLYCVVCISIMIFILLMNDIPLILIL